MDCRAVGAGGAFDIAVQGYRKATRRMDAAAAKIASGKPDALDPEPMIDLKLAEHQGRANLSVIRVADRMQQSVLDILA
jgi:hypothetical protein